jgi:hypothetical protein
MENKTTPWHGVVLRDQRLRRTLLDEKRLRFFGSPVLFSL